MGDDQQLGPRLRAVLQRRHLVAKVGAGDPLAELELRFGAHVAGWARRVDEAVSASFCGAGSSPVERVPRVQHAPGGGDPKASPSHGPPLRVQHAAVVGGERFPNGDVVQRRLRAVTQDR